MSMPTFPPILRIPDYEPLESGLSIYPSNIEPGDYTLPDLVELLRANKNNPDAIQFIADMLEE